LSIHKSITAAIPLVEANTAATYLCFYSNC